MYIYRCRDNLRINISVHMNKRRTRHCTYCNSNNLNDVIYNTTDAGAPLNKLDISRSIFCIAGKVPEKSYHIKTRKLMKIWYFLTKLINLKNWNSPHQKDYKHRKSYCKTYNAYKCCNTIQAHLVKDIYKTH